MIFHRSAAIASIIIAGLNTTAGCAGKLELPERVYKSADADMTCEDLSQESEDLVRRLPGLETDLSQNRSTNLGVWIAGQLLLIPTIGMDVTGNAEIQRLAVIRRLERLQEMAITRNCS